MNPRFFQVSQSSPSLHRHALIVLEYLHAHLRKSKIEDLISEHTTGFLDTVITVEVSTGAAFKPMKLHTNTFAPSGDELTWQSSLTPPQPEQAAQLVRRPSVPVGILALSPTDMRRKCNKHVEDMISSPQYPEQATAGDASGLPKQILEIVCEYVAANKDVSVPAESSLYRLMLMEAPRCLFSKTR